MAELERQERLSDDVLRYLTVKVDALDEGPSILMQSRSSREDRPRRPHDDDERPRRARDDEERPRRARDDSARRGHDETEDAKVDTAPSATGEDEN